MASPPDPGGGPDPIGDRAVVLGGSIAGLLAARVLSDHFERVVIIERDVFPDGPTTRKGVPQAHHIHGLLLRGRELVEELLPGVTEELVGHGARRCSRSPATPRVLRPFGWTPVFDSNLRVISSSRELLEWVVRTRVLAHPNITTLTATAVAGLASSPGRTRVTGVVVDAASDAGSGGRGAHGGSRGRRDQSRVDAPARWLQELGYESPRETWVNAHWGYASRFYLAPEAWEPSPTLVTGGFPLNDTGTGKRRTRGISLVPQDRGRWIVTLWGCAKDYPPSDEPGFSQWVQDTADDFPQIREFVETGEPVSPIRATRSTVNRRRH